MKTTLYILSAAVMLLTACGPADNKDLQHANFPKVENDNYYNRSGGHDEGTTHSGSANEGDTLNSHGDGRNLDVMEDKKEH